MNKRKNDLAVNTDAPIFQSECIEKLRGKNS